MVVTTTGMARNSDLAVAKRQEEIAQVEYLEGPVGTNICLTMFACSCLESRTRVGSPAIEAPATSTERSS